jgi:outer membrane protein assembly factor BamB
MLRIASLIAVLTAAVNAAAVASPVANKPFPDVIQLPTGFRPEGIEIGRGTTFYVGSVASGAVYRGDLRTGSGAILVPGEAGKSATGIELDDHNRLFVAGAATGKAYVYDADTGQLLRTYTFATAPTFINDAVVTHDAVFFTDSMKAVLYRIPIGPGGALGDFETIPLSGDFVLQPGFNLNGIDATPNGKTLVAVQTNTGKVFRIDPATGVADEISLGGESVANGDGMLLDGKTLYVVQNQLNRVAVIALSPDLAAGRVVTRVTDPDFDVPTTIDELGRRLYAVNARFANPDPANAAFQVVQLAKQH